MIWFHVMKSSLISCRFRQSTPLAKWRYSLRGAWCWCCPLLSGDFWITRNHWHNFSADSIACCKYHLFIITALQWNWRVILSQVSVFLFGKGCMVSLMPGPFLVPGPTSFRGVEYLWCHVHWEGEVGCQGGRVWGSKVLRGVGYEYPWCRVSRIRYPEEVGIPYRYSIEATEMLSCIV